MVKKIASRVYMGLIFLFLYLPVEREASPFNLGFGVVEGEYY